MINTWLEPWGEISEDQKAFFKNELFNEVASSHPLFGLQLEPIGRSFANDDVLFSLDDTRLAVVHLTWSGRGNSVFPDTVFFDTWSDFVIQKMTIDNFGY